MRDCHGYKQRSFRKAKIHIEQAGLKDKIETRLSNGLDKLEIGEADTILISGMGGALITEILTKEKDKTLRQRNLFYRLSQKYIL